jgi:lysophospholipid acyltransferase (LPLAT)-like uncharacterized protein
VKAASSSKEELKTKLISSVGGSMIDGLMRSTRSELIHGHEVESEIMIPRVPVIYVLWHGRLLPTSYRYRTFDFATLITQNRDGDYITGVIQKWGYEVIRGSSSRGGAAALRAIIRAVRRGKPVALTPDGPRGPRQKMKLGPMRAAQIAGVPIVPITAGAVRAKYFGRWDRFLVPAPFTWIPVAVGEPYVVDRNASEEELQAGADIVEHRLNQLTLMVDEAASAARR